MFSSSSSSPKPKKNRSFAIFPKQKKIRILSFGRGQPHSYFIRYQNKTTLSSYTWWSWIFRGKYNFPSYYDNLRFSFWFLNEDRCCLNLSYWLYFSYDLFLTLQFLVESFTIISSIVFYVVTGVNFLCYTQKSNDASDVTFAILGYVEIFYGRNVHC